MTDRNLLLSEMAKKGYNTTGLAKRIGVTNNTMTNVLNGNNKPSYSVLNAIYYTLKLTPETFVKIFFSKKLKE